MNYLHFLEHVSRRVGEPLSLELERATRAVLHSLGECLSRDTAERLATELPEEAAAAVRGAGHGHALKLPEWVRHVRYRAGVHPGLALELSLAVGEELAELPAHLIETVRQELPASISEFFTPPPSPPLQ